MRRVQATIRECDELGINHLGLADEADLAARLEHGPPHVLERRDPLDAGGGTQLAERDPVAGEVAVDRLAVLDDDHRLAVEHGPKGKEA